MQIEFPKPSYSQCGEDQICEFLFRMLGINRPLRYLDLGAANPIDENNTYWSYAKGGSGVLVEADPKYLPLYAEVRPNDVHLSNAIMPHCADGETVEFFFSENPGWSTAVKEHAILAASIGKGALAEPVTLNAVAINDVVQGHFADGGLDLLSVDVEGLDHKLLGALDFSIARPKVVVVENSHGERIHDDVMQTNNYVMYGYTFVNSIYACREELAAARF